IFNSPKQSVVLNVFTVMNTLQQAKDKELKCPVPHNQRKPMWMWMKRLGWAGFFFFLIKGLLWLIIPYLIAKGLF
ncbi:MAG: hypothetical protein ACK45I_03765, partial [Bacteroidota bacterium]